MKKVITFVLVIVALLTPVFAQGGNEATSGPQTRHFVIATTYPNSTGTAAPLTNQKAIYPFIDKLAEVSGGLLTAEVSWGGALGNTTQLFSQVAQGTIDMTMCGLDVLGSLKNASDTAVFSVPYLFDDYDHIHRYINSDAFKSYAKGIEEANKMVILADMGPGDARNLNTNRPIRTVADVKNLKLRVAESPASIAVWKAWGANPVVINASEIYSALENGLCDGWENTINAFYKMKTVEPAHYISQIEYKQQGVVVLMGKSTYDSLSEQEKAWIAEAFEYAYQHNMDETYGTGEYEKGAEAMQIEKMLADPSFKGVFVDNLDIESFKKTALEVAKQLEGSLFSVGLVDTIRSMSKEN
ncbi:MAG: TRAP transporter substrate-binding protein [Sphaerochaetaceae bacterium]|nr:TRAP transporter substrate-binding protein [Sphaerochaetaceae bacterium]